MTSTLSKTTTKSTVIPSLRYRNALAAIDWLCDVLGFEKNAVYADDQGTVMHAQLTHSGGMIMLGSANNRNAYNQLIKHPDEIGGAQTQTTYLVVPDADAVYEKVKASGAHIIMPNEDKEYGGRGFTCADPEGHVWSIGTYDPWASE